MNDQPSNSAFDLSVQLGTCMYITRLPISHCFVTIGNPERRLSVNCCRYSVVNNFTADGTSWRSQLLISKFQDGDFGAFTCTATNQFGSASWTILVSKQTTTPSLLGQSALCQTRLSILCRIVPQVMRSQQ